MSFLCRVTEFKSSNIEREFGLQLLLLSTDLSVQYLVRIKRKRVPAVISQKVPFLSKLWKDLNCSQTEYKPDIINSSNQK